MGRLEGLPALPLREHNCLLARCWSWRPERFGRLLLRPRPSGDGRDRRHRGRTTCERKGDKAAHCTDSDGSPHRSTDAARAADCPRFEPLGHPLEKRGRIDAGPPESDEQQHRRGEESDLTGLEEDRACEASGDGNRNRNGAADPHCSIVSGLTVAHCWGDCKDSPTRETRSGESGRRYEGERRDSNPRPPGPQPGALPAELRPPRRRRVYELS